MLKFATVAAASALLFAAPAFAGGLVAEQVIELVQTTQTAEGEIKTQFVAADKVVPGDQLIYRLRYANEGKDAAEKAVLTLPVPTEVAYVDHSANAPDPDADIVFSVDGGQNFVNRRALTVTENGATRPARADEITHIRFTFADPITPQEKGEITFRATVE